MKQQTKFKQTEIGMIPEDWEAKKVKDFCIKITSGGTPARVVPSYWNKGEIPWLKTQELRDNRIYYAEEKITKEGLENSSAKIFPKGTVVMAMYGATVGKLGILEVESTTNQACCAMIVDRNKSNPKFLFYALLNYRHKLINLASGAAQQNLNQDIIKEFQLPSPSKNEQSSISKILSDLDSKIEINQQMNKTLEAIGQAIFKHWFVDFEFPNEEGKPYKSSGGEMVPSELGQMPKGWRLGCLGEVAENPRRGILPGAVEQGTPYIGLEHMPRRSIALSDWETVEEVVSNKFQFYQGEILFGKLRPYFHKVGVAAMNGVCSTDILVIVPKSPEWYGLVLGHISSEEFVNYADAASTGTRMPRTNWEDMARYEIMIPTNSVAQVFNDKIVPLVQKITANILQSRTLAAIRDSLLPKLMSGKIRVPIEVQT